MRVLSLGALAIAILVSASANVVSPSAKENLGAEPRIANASPTFSKDVAPILYSKCVSCHRAGEIGPMSLISYREVRPWAASIRDKVSNRIMPPWHADQQYGSFRNDRSLTSAQIDTIVRWASAGAPEGNPQDLPAVPAFADGWQIGKPDVVFEMTKEFEIPARGTVEYQYFEVPTNFKDDVWMQAGEARAGDRAHVHHIIVSAIEPPGSRQPTTAMTMRPIVSESAAAPAVPPVARAPRELTEEQRA